VRGDELSRYVAIHDSYEGGADMCCAYPPAMPSLLPPLSRATSPEPRFGLFRMNPIERNYEFYRLLDAVLNEPEKVPSIVSERRAILEEKNCLGETVLHWLAVENHVEGVALLRLLGARIPAYAIVHAIEAGHTEMVTRLLELGGDIRGIDLEGVLGNPLWGLSQKKKEFIRRYFSQYDYSWPNLCRTREHLKFHLKPQSRTRKSASSQTRSPAGKCRSG